ncbi:MAG: Bax inhibitor-1/YccA family protein [Phycisphaerales bacterium]|nr:MAG: Bax inhibitor-1/YccA family protein [Phycisphaerales bacterium]
MWNSSNPALTREDAFGDYYGKSMFAERTDITTLSGVVNKTGLLVSIAIVTGAIGYSVTVAVPAAMWISAIASLVICLGLFFVISGKPSSAPVVAPIYAVVEGFFLGAFTSVADAILAARNLTMVGGVGLQAMIITLCAVIAMLLLYKAKIIRPTRTLQAIIFTATGAIMLAYLVSFVLSFFGMPLPLISFASAVSDQGLMGLLGLGINILILVVASLWLVFDFKLVEDKVKAAAPKYMEWYCGFALLVTLAWIYFESVKLVVRLAVLFGNRD